MRLAAEEATGDTVRHWRIITAVLAGGLCLRPPIVAVATLLPDIRTDLGLTYANGGLMTAIPIICMGLFALPAMRLYSLLGAGRALFLSLALTVLGGTLRALTWDIPLMYALTMAAGVGAGLAGAMFPAIVRRLPAGVRARATGFYSLGVNGGAGFTAAFAVPFARAAGGWRGAFLALGFAGIWSMAAWLIFTRRELAPPGHAAAGRFAAWRFPLALQLGLVFGLQAVCFFGLNAWLATAYVEWAWPANRAGWLVATLNLATLPSSLLVGLLGNRVAPALLLSFAAGALFFALCGTAAVPELGWLWTSVAGFACGALFPLILIMGVNAARTPNEAAAISGVILSIGYLVAGTAPVLLGAVRDLARGFAWAFACLAAVSLVLLACCVALKRGAAERQPSD